MFYCVIINSVNKRHTNINGGKINERQSEKYGVEPFNKTAFYKLISYILKEECISA